MLLFFAACAWHPPVETPALTAAAGPVQTVRVMGGDGRLRVAVRAGSAHDPPGREGLAWVTAHAVAAAADAEVEVGPEVVLFQVNPADAGRLAVALTTPPDAGRVAAAAEEAVRALDSLDCRALAERAWDSWIYMGHPYGHAPEGRRSVLPTLSAAEVAGFQQVRYVKTAVVLGLPEGVPVHPFFEQLPPLTSSSPVPATQLPLPTERVLAVASPGQRCMVAGNPASAPRDAAGHAAEVLLANDAVSVARRQARNLVYLPLPTGGVPVKSFVSSMLEGDWLSSWQTSTALAARPVEDPTERALVSALLARDPWPSLVAHAGASPGGTAADVATPPPAPPTDAAVNAALTSWLDPAQVHVVVVLPPDEAVGDALVALAGGAESSPTLVVQRAIPAPELFK